MINLKGRIIILLFTFLISSCGTFSEPIHNQGKVDINKSNLKQLNGNYSRFSNTYLDTNTAYDFNDLFQCFYLWKEKKLRDTSTSEKDFVALEVIDEKRIKVSFIKNGQIVKSKILKGELTENTFVFNGRNFLIPLIFINFGERHRTRISLSENGSLNLDAFQFAMGNFFIFPWTSGHYEEYDLEFNKIAEK
ncbi:hypothetical protein [Gramella sp. KN1008]|uniref:hypothetical protein n=1 Tax=Gramella sp. KN1008 TaxID=2529298 RepID=UPI00103C4E7B|nr:hypothetical protein [Gramella sp. KN1008]TBW29943.1 hypothetical protein EZJ28_00630 [Gramella sp. KN1008]